MTFAILSLCVFSGITIGHAICRRLGV